MHCESSAQAHWPSVQCAAWHWSQMPAAKQKQTTQTSAAQRTFFLVRKAKLVFFFRKYLSSKKISNFSRTSSSSRCVKENCCHLRSFECDFNLEFFRINFFAWRSVPTLEKQWKSVTNSVSSTLTRMKTHTHVLATPEVQQYCFQYWIMFPCAMFQFVSSFLPLKSLVLHKHICVPMHQVALSHIEQIKTLPDHRKTRSHAPMVETWVLGSQTHMGQRSVVSVTRNQSPDFWRKQQKHLVPAPEFQSKATKIAPWI